MRASKALLKLFEIVSLCYCYVYLNNQMELPIERP